MNITIIMIIIGFSFSAFISNNPHGDGMAGKKRTLIPK